MSKPEIDRGQWSCSTVLSSTMVNTAAKYKLHGKLYLIKQSIY
jgi:hypothetical protein